MRTHRGALIRVPGGTIIKGPTLKDSIIVVVTIIDIGGVLVVVLVVLGVVLVVVGVVASHYCYKN